ncbi:thioesterase [Bacteroidia bacterium]|nr:thioesterase [Bacteroidia bacterium]
MIKEGAVFVCETTVGGDNLAVAMGSGDMEVFATPAMVALMERAAKEAVAAGLPAESTTVGTRIEVSHLRATPPGALVTARATLAQVDGRRLTFRVEAHDPRGLVGEGSHERFIVDRERFLAKL